MFAQMKSNRQYTEEELAAIRAYQATPEYRRKRVIGIGGLTGALMGVSLGFLGTYVLATAAKASGADPSSLALAYCVMPVSTVVGAGVGCLAGKRIYEISTDK